MSLTTVTLWIASTRRRIVLGWLSMFVWLQRITACLLVTLRHTLIMMRGKMLKPCFSSLDEWVTILKPRKQHSTTKIGYLGYTASVKNSSYYPTWLLASERFHLKYIDDGEDTVQLWSTRGVIQSWTLHSHSDWESQGAFPTWLALTATSSQYLTKTRCLEVAGTRDCVRADVDERMKNAVQHLRHKTSKILTNDR